MHSLDAIQRWVQTVIMHPEGVRQGAASSEARAILPVGPNQVERIVTPSEALSGMERLEIYHRAYYARLLECLREEFPVTRHAVGEDAFDQFALDYLQKYPSRGYTLNALGAQFPRYLSESSPAEEDWPEFVIDLATLEQAFNEVFDGPGVEGQRLLDAEALTAVAPEHWPEVRLVPVPCLRLLTLRYPAHHYFAAVRGKKEPRLPRKRATFLAITRRDYVVRRYRVSRAQSFLLQALVAGRPIGEAIVLAAEAGRLNPNALGVWFRNWTAEGFFQAIRP